MDGERSITAEMHECFGAIITRLDGIEDYEKELNEGSNGLLGGGTNEINTIPYGKPSGCHNRLVVIIDGKKDIDSVLMDAYKHVEISCKGKTTKILFYIAYNNNRWDLHWNKYKHLFDSLVTNKAIAYWIYISKRSSVGNNHSSFKIDLKDIRNILSLKYKYEKIQPSNDDAEELYYSESLSVINKSGTSTLIYFIRFIKTANVNLYSFYLLYLPSVELTAESINNELKEIKAIERIANLFQYDLQAHMDQKLEIINISFSSSILDGAILKALVEKTEVIVSIIKELKEELKPPKGSGKGGRRV